MAKSLHKIVFYLILFALAWTNFADAQVYMETGKIGLRLSDAGSIRVYAPTTNDDRHIGRVNIIAALSEDAVSDYEQDHNSMDGAYILTTPTVADTEAFVIFSSDYSSLPPYVLYSLHLYSWINESFAICRYAVINNYPQEETFHLGAIALPQVTGSYGLETNSYNTTHLTAFTYRSGETNFAGIRLLTKDPVSYHALDWNVYSPDDPATDAATDSTRYHMTADPGFDADMTAGVDGSIFSLNAGVYTIAAGDSAILFYAVCFGESEDALMTASDAALAKYNSTFTAIENPHETINSYALMQNFPNPFNPETKLRFSIDHRENVSLNVYNLAGQEVASLVNKALNPGEYEITFNGNSLPSGVYFYTLRSGNRTETRKMLLVR
jgi:hypothetical protein